LDALREEEAGPLEDGVDALDRPAEPLGDDFAGEPLAAAGLEDRARRPFQPREAGRQRVLQVRPGPAGAERVAQLFEDALGQRGGGAPLLAQRLEGLAP